MVEAVAKVKSDYPPLVLAVEQDFEGSRGYGFLDYIILYQDLAIVITSEADTQGNCTEYRTASYHGRGMLGVHVARCRLLFTDR